MRVCSDDDESKMIKSNSSHKNAVAYYSGLVAKSEIQQFKRLLFRATHGKVLCKIVENSESDKHVFVLVFQDIPMLKSKIDRIASIFCSDQFELPSDGRGSYQEFT